MNHNGQDLPPVESLECDRDAIREALRKRRPDLVGSDNRIAWGEVQRLAQEQLSRAEVAEAVQAVLHHPLEQKDVPNKEVLRKLVNNGQGPTVLKFVVLALAAGLDAADWRKLTRNGAAKNHATLAPAVVPSIAERTAPASTDIVRLAVLRPVDIAYTQDIFTSLISTLGEQLGDRLRLVVDRLVPIDGDLTDPKNRKQALREAGAFVEAAADRHANYLVPIGTQAAVPLKDALGHRFGSTNFLFLGVTDPVQCGLVDWRGTETQSRSEERNVTGVDYGLELTAIASWIRNRLCPGTRPIRFVYRQGVTQDEQIAAKLQQESWKSRHLTIHCTPGYPTEADLSHPDDPIYFSWHTFEDMYENPAYRAVLRDKFTVASSRRNVEDGFAAIGYSADDFEIGRLGAVHVLEHLARPHLRFGHRWVTSPRFRCWIHRDRLAELTARTGFTLPPDIENDPQTTFFRQPAEAGSSPTSSSA